MKIGFQETKEWAIDWRKPEVSMVDTSQVTAVSQNASDNRSLMLYSFKSLSGAEMLAKPGTKFQ